MSKRIGFIVEGFHDEVTMKKVFPEAKFIVLQAKYNRRVKMSIDSALKEGYTIFILTDPDDAGDHYAKRILEDYNFKQLHIEADKCQCYRNHKLKIGIEHADLNYLKETLSKQIWG